MYAMEGGEGGERWSRRRLGRDGGRPEPVGGAGIGGGGEWGEDLWRMLGSAVDHSSTSILVLNTHLKNQGKTYAENFGRRGSGSSGQDEGPRRLKGEGEKASQKQMRLIKSPRLKKGLKSEGQKDRVRGKGTRRRGGRHRKFPKRGDGTSGGLCKNGKKRDDR